MLTVGLTGNIASGKSSVAAVWRDLGGVVVDADLLARQAVEPGSQALNRIVERWGEGVLAADGTLDRAALREIVFRDDAARRELEAIVHPRVGELRAGAFEDAAAAGAPIVVADVPLLFEAGLQDRFDVVVLVDAPEELRRRRIVEHRGIEPGVADRMIAAQMPAQEKRGRAAIVIDNDGSADLLRQRAIEAWRHLESMERERR